ncbi:MAG: type II toxin-antitoxin system RelE/ParE family toxin [bacterium]
MEYKTIILPYFRKQLKHYIKKYRSLKGAVIKELGGFDKKKAAHIGNNVYKMRLKCDDITKGKSKSFRLIILIIEADNFLVPITLYFKGDSENISKKELNDHLEKILLEL